MRKSETTFWYFETTTCQTLNAKMPFPRKNLVLELVGPFLLTLGVVIPLFYQVVVLASQQPDNFNTFYSFSSGLNGYYGLKTAWKTRLLSNALAWQVDRLSAWIMSHINVQYINRPQPFAVALWTVGWFVLICLVYIVLLRRRSVFYIFGTYAALTFGYIPKLPATRIYPWDMPALFIYVLFLFLFLGNRFRWLLLLLPLGMGFKETTGVLCLAFLLSNELTAGQKWKMFGAALALCVAVKVGIDIFTRSASPFFTMETGLGGAASSIYLINNVGSLASWPVFLVNAGSLLAFLILPTSDKKLVALKILAGVFALGNFLFGTILEFRIWFELIPFALYAIGSLSYREEPAPARQNAKSDESAKEEAPGPQHR